MQHRFQGWRPPRSVFVLHDLTPHAGHAAWRAATIAREHGAELCLLHVANGPQGTARSRTALEKLALRLREQFGVLPEVRIVHGDPVAAVVRAGSSAGLVVLGSQRVNVLRDWIFGTPAERLIRLWGGPVLVVKNAARAGYRRVLVPIAFGPDAAAAVGAAASLSGGAGIEVFHSLAIRHELTLRAADVPEATVREVRRRSADRARARLDQLALTLPPAGPPVVASIGFGHPTSMVLLKEQAMRADLVVMAKRRRGRLADFFLGSVSQRVLARSRSDVLVLPSGGRGSGQRAALAESPV